VTEELTSLHSSDGGLDGRHLDDGQSLAPLRSSPFSLWAMEVPTDREVSDSPSR
ncbi:hypothetical protein HAX54_030075, partial [Datura stramonium]|nr:hypothetical protein [Datura stramonium]